ncbi:MAG: 30S ribosomal protein S18 [Elusimicrobia bacterium RIFOXYB2_FULL_49_7]|nr:MAG: 30S ribosomal protein S18 [Elusimicrobia bacterium RIFOXYB2_FULL_49_7]
MIKRMDKPRNCFFCENENEKIDYKNEKQMQYHVDELGKIVGRSRTSLCALHQRHMTTAIKRARHIALIPFVMENVR